MQPILTIHRSAIANNYRTLQALAGGAAVAGVVKANGYGLGVEVVAPILIEQGVDTFFVAAQSEGIALRHITPNASVYVLNGFTNAAELASLRAHGLSPIINSLTAAKAHDGGHAALHIDTGMRRLGLDNRETKAFLNSPVPIKEMLLMSHLASADDHTEDSQQTAAQVTEFTNLVEALEPTSASLNNSAGTLFENLPRYDLVRPGIAMMGCAPRPTKGHFEQVISLSAPILQIREVDAGDPVGYNATWTAQQPSRIATLPVGYADGFIRSQSHATGAPSEADVALDGQRLPIVGRVSMDLITVDVTDAPAALAPGDHLEIIGETISVQEVANRAGTIPYEILTSLGSRYERVVI